MFGPEVVMGVRVTMAALGATLLLGFLTAPGAAVAHAAASDPCSFVVTIPVGSTVAPSRLPTSLRKKIRACAHVMKDGSTRAAIRLGKTPNATEKSWRAAVVTQFVRDGCTDISGGALISPSCNVFVEDWADGYPGKAARGGTVVVSGIEPI